MAQDTGRNSRVARLSGSAEKDLFAIYFYTVQQWGHSQAENYREFLRVTMEELANDPAKVPLVRKLPDVHCHTARWKNARQGHRIFYQQTDYGILVLRILHTSMNWQEKLDGTE